MYVGQHVVPQGCAVAVEVIEASLYIAPFRYGGLDEGWGFAAADVDVL